jgi:DNA-binding transcriptional LysR family regulator
MKNFRHLDLNLLRVLAAIHRTRSVTAAARALSLSQPATSNALARLRGFFEDDLFVRSPKGLVPTRACEAVAPQVEAMLRELESLVAGPQAFLPAESDIRWRLSLSDLGEMMFLPPLVAALREQAPSTQLVNLSVAAEDLPQVLEAREIDFAIGILHPRQRGIHADLLFSEEYVAVSSPGWAPRKGGRTRTRLTQEQLADAHLAVAAPAATFHASVEQMLQRLQITNRVAVRARHFGALADLALGSDLLTIVPAMYARDLQRRQGLRTWTLPQAAAARYDVRLVWHTATAQDPAQVWIRALVQGLFRRGATTPASGVSAARRSR